MKYKELEELFFIDSPYHEFPLDLNPKMISGWHSESPIFRRLIEKHQPSLYIEVGTWLGASAIHAAGILEELGLDTPIICVDTWLGSQEFWHDIRRNPRYQDLSLSFGYPRIYYQFLANVLHCGFENRILPFPQTSVIAARIFQTKNIQANMIYIDGSHDAGDVYRDLQAYWPLLAPGGILFGDDFDEFWPGLMQDVRDFGEDHSVHLETEKEFWVLQKPADYSPDADHPADTEKRRVEQLERQRDQLLKNLDEMTRRAGHFHEEYVQLERLLRDKSNDSGATDEDIKKLREERNVLERTCGFYYEEMKGHKLAREQIEARLDEIQEINLKTTAENERLRESLLKLKKALGDSSTI